MQRSSTQVKGPDRFTDVVAGIAWDEMEKRLFVTGKYWPRLFEITVGDPVGPDQRPEAEQAAAACIRG